MQSTAWTEAAGNRTNTPIETAPIQPAMADPIECFVFGHRDLPGITTSVSGSL